MPSANSTLPFIMSFAANQFAAAKPLSRERFATSFRALDAKPIGTEG
jgi:hypothetical protein